MTDNQQRLGQIIIDEYEAAPDQSTFFSGSNAEAIAEQYSLRKADVAEVMEQVGREYEAEPIAEGEDFQLIAWEFKAAYLANSDRYGWDVIHAPTQEIAEDLAKRHYGYGHIGPYVVRRQEAAATIGATGLISAALLLIKASGPVSAKEIEQELLIQVQGVTGENAAEKAQAAIRYLIEGRHVEIYDETESIPTYW